MKSLLLVAIAMILAKTASSQPHAPAVLETAKREVLSACEIIGKDYDASVRAEAAGWVDMSESSVEAFALCGKLRAVEAIPTLVRFLHVSRYGIHVGPRPLDEGGYPYPAAPALIRIGAPAVPALVHGFAGQLSLDWPYQAHLCIAAIAGPGGGVRAFKEAMARAETDAERVKYREALAEFLKLEDVPLIVEGGYQLFHGNVRETLQAAQGDRKSVKE
jgi:hypothetical protein